MATVALDVSSVISATGWTGATVANLTTANGVRATDGRPGEFILVELTDTPGDFGNVSGDIVLRVRARTVGSVSRAKSVLLELLDSAGNVLGSGSTASLTGSDADYLVTISGRADDKATADGYRLRYTVQEGSGMGDSATVEIDRIWVDPVTYAAAVLSFDPAVAEATWSASAPTFTPGAVNFAPAAAEAGWSASTPTFAVQDPGVTFEPAVAEASWVAATPGFAPGPVALEPAVAEAAWGAPTPAFAAGAASFAPAAPAANWTASDPTFVVPGSEEPACIMGRGWHL